MWHPGLCGCWHVHNAQCHRTESESERKREGDSESKNGFIKAAFMPSCHFALIMLMRSQVAQNELWIMYKIGTDTYHPLPLSRGFKCDAPKIQINDMNAIVFALAVFAVLILCARWNNAAQHYYGALRRAYPIAIVGIHRFSSLYL